MGSEEASSHSEAPQTDTAGAKSGPRRGRRSGRGRRSHGRRPRPTREPAHPPAIPESVQGTPVEEPEAVFELATEQPVYEREAPATADSETAAEPPPAAPRPRAEPPVQPASLATVQEAIEEVNSIVDALRGALDDMEEVLEMLELFERQKNADEREIDSLRRALRQIHRPREGGHQR